VTGRERQDAEAERQDRRGEPGQEGQQDGLGEPRRRDQGLPGIEGQVRAAEARQIAEGRKDGADQPGGDRPQKQGEGQARNEAEQAFATPGRRAQDGRRCSGGRCRQRISC
jgi:hypothetical protein